MTFATSYLVNIIYFVGISNTTFHQIKKNKIKKQLRAFCSYNKFIATNVRAFLDCMIKQNKLTLTTHCLSKSMFRLLLSIVQIEKFFLIIAHDFYVKLYF